MHTPTGKIILLGSLFRCVQPTLTVCAALGYKPPFLCPLGKEAEANASIHTHINIHVHTHTHIYSLYEGKEAEANAAKRELARDSESDHVALVAALEG